MTVVACPACGRDAEFSPRNPSRPFCSMRCKTLDLGAWASEQYRIAAQDEPLSDEDGDESPTQRSIG
jgi:endogenous inhibitor of DNA gyrase (YacG/DUF329 family)